MAETGEQSKELVAIELVVAEERTVLAADLLVGDVLVSAALGGYYDAEVTSVHVDVELVRVRLEGDRLLYLARHEVVIVRRMKAAADELVDTLRDIGGLKR